MERLFTLICCCISLLAKAQCDWTSIHFENDTCARHLLVMDSSHHRNQWQIGAPHKSVFDSALSLPNAMITDTVHKYLMGDTSVFILKVPAVMVECPINPNAPFIRLNFSYQLDIDTNAKAILEVSEDSGAHWINIADSLPSTMGWVGATPPDFATPTAGWTPFALAHSFSDTSGDTILFRFTFITDSSDSIYGQRDGWMIDNIWLWYWCEGEVHNTGRSEKVSVFPNPSTGDINIQTTAPSSSATITISNMLGQQVYRKRVPQNGRLNLNLPNGIYTLRYSDEVEYCVKQVVIQH
jgi:hypothetical protein